jgi:hypothetical protein
MPLLHRDRPVLSMRDEERSLNLDPLGLDLRNQRLEILGRRVDVLISSYEDVGGGVSAITVSF